MDQVYYMSLVMVLEPVSQSVRAPAVIEKLHLKALKKLKPKPNLRASTLNKDKSKPQGNGKRPGSANRSKKTNFHVDEEIIIEPDEIPAGAKFNGYRDYDVQELRFERHNIRFRLAEYVTVEGKTVVGRLPVEYRNGHYGPVLLSYIVHQYYGCRVTQPLIYEELHALGIEISTGQINNILSEHTQQFATEQQQVLGAGLTCSSHIHTDDTGSRHQGKTDIAQ